MGLIRPSPFKSRHRRQSFTTLLWTYTRLLLFTKRKTKLMLIDENTSDGYHTFKELYDFRMLYHAHCVKAWNDRGFETVKSKRHHDGELCFGGGRFIVVTELETGQIRNHYSMEHWDLFDVPEAPTSPKWDGHTSEDVADRLRESLKP